MAVPAVDESWRQDWILAREAPPRRAEFQRHGPSTFGVNVHGPVFSHKVGVGRARAPQPEDLGGLQREAWASAEEHGRPGTRPGAATGPHSARCTCARGRPDLNLHGAVGAAVLSLRQTLIGKPSAQKNYDITETTPFAPASPPRAALKLGRRSQIDGRAQQGDVQAVCQAVVQVQKASALVNDEGSPCQQVPIEMG
ncbi:unnamed protein product [Prorocentrum cordatum]|uniref:Uncharacterized protein n=1 Tax=Prorocentrum cordatum TaxID=2364126 RepID=A0ABN9XZF4_9DINO|nr:unnamed protein product [Polarella glacialis]